MPGISRFPPSAGLNQATSIGQSADAQLVAALEPGLQLFEIPDTPVRLRVKKPLIQ